MVRTSGVAVIVFLVSVPIAAHAERRAFVNTYEYLTMDEHAVQLDASTTQAYGTGSDTTRAFELQLDAAFGITERWDIAAYQVYDQTSDDDPMSADIPFRYKESRVRTRYRFAERGELPVDLLGMLEARKSFLTDAWGIAPRVVVVREIDKLELVGNALVDIEFGAGTTNVDFGWSVGATYEIVSELKAGLEAFGSSRLNGASRTLAWIGPSVSWAPTSRAWIAANAGFGLTDASIDLRQQVIIGLVL